MMATWFCRAVGTLFFICFLFFAVMTAASRLMPHHHRPPPPHPAESWRPELARIRTIDAAMRELPAYIARQHGSRDARVAAGIDQFIRDRFYHDGSYVSVRSNWLAFMAGSVWLNLRIPVLPDAILRHRSAMCSQQAIVFMELLKRYNIHYGAVLMNWPSSDPFSQGHFAVTARIDGRWIYFDPDQEAEQAGVPVAHVLDGSALPALYGRKPALLANMRYAAAHGRIQLAHIDEDPAPRGGLFEKATEWLSAWGWLLFGLLTAAFLLLRRRARWPALSRPAPGARPAAG
jgi:hypothetical protein